MSDVKDEIDWEWVGANLMEDLAKNFIQCHTCIVLQKDFEHQKEMGWDVTLISTLGNKMKPCSLALLGKVSFLRPTKIFEPLKSLRGFSS